MRLEAHGIAVDIPRGWDARIFRRAESAAMSPADAGSGDSDSMVGSSGGAVPMSGFVAPVLHLGNFALPENRGDYGSGAVDQMRTDSVFLSLIDFGSESDGESLFAAKGLPKLSGSEFSSRNMQRPMAGRGATQRFFTTGGRAMGLYAVVGSTKYRTALAALLNSAINRITVNPR